MRRIFYDFEFIEDGSTIAPLSVGMVDYQGNTYEAVFHDAPWERVAAHPWLMENVVPHLPLQVDPPQPMFGKSHPTLVPDTTDHRVKPGWVIANEVREFITRRRGPNRGVELWGDHPAYDHVCLAQLWGTMVDLPEGVPMRTHCVAQLAAFLEAPVSEQSGVAHDAMGDALHVRDVYEYLCDYNTEPVTT